MATKKAASAKKSVPPRERGTTPTRKRQPSARKRAPSAEQEEPSARQKEPSAKEQEPSAQQKDPGQIARLAAQQLLQLTGRAAEGVTALERKDEGWRVEIEVLETRRIPDTTDMLAVYDVEVDGSGNLVGYSRMRRYVRGREDGEGR